MSTEKLVPEERTIDLGPIKIPVRSGENAATIVTRFDDIADMQKLAQGVRSRLRVELAAQLRALS